MSLQPTIPPMTHPLSRAWDQPLISAIEFRGDSAWMTLATFKALPEYNTTQPSGVYEGKMWKRLDGLGVNQMRRLRGLPDQPMQWLLCWFGPSDDPKYVSNNYAPIKLTDGLISAQDGK